MPKKEKKHKKSKDRKQAREASDSSDSSSSEEEWVEASDVGRKDCKGPPVQQRDAWMDIQDDFIPTFTAEEHRAQKKAKRAEESHRRKTLQTTDAPGTHERELNPYWKDGGTGLPREKDERCKEATLTQSNVGDGGSRWLRQAYRRIQEQASEEGRSVEEIAAERYGSLEKLQSMIREAEARSGTDRRERHGSYDRRDRRRRHRETGHMMRPPSDEESDASSGAYRRERYTMRKPSGDDADRYSESPCRSDRESRSGMSKTRDEYLEQQRNKRPAVQGSPDDGDSDALSRQSDGRSSLHASRPRWIKKEYFEEPSRAPGRATPEKPLATTEQMQCEPSSPESNAEPTPEPAVEQRRRLLSDQEMNVLGAKLIKAEITGNTALYEKLKKEIEAARAERESAGPAASPGASTKRGEKEVVVLTKTDGRGFARPLSEPVGGAERTKRKIKAATHDRGGERTSYFADDSRLSLKEMFQREKGTTAEDQNMEFARLAGKVKASTSREDFDDAAVDAASRYDSSARQDAHDRTRAIQEHKRLSKSLEKCRFCIDSPEMKKHLIVAIGLRTYLCVPPYQSLTEGHCLIVPQSHVASGTLVDEDVWLEMQIFRKGLARMFEDMDQDTVFMETAMGFRHHPHSLLECIPVPKDVGNMAPMYFKKAILESETEWAQNKKLVDLSQKGLRNSIPRGLPYFAVDFGLQSGFAHVIEDEKEFPWYFGKEIVGGMLDLEPRLWRKAQPEKFEEQRMKVMKFLEWWKPYDWTERVKSEMRK